MNAMIILFILNAVFATLSFAEDCKVSGISDSPQNITCNYRDGWNHKVSLQITCESGTYFSNESVGNAVLEKTPILTAYHEEVSRGVSPLVFKLGDQRTLRITKVLGLFHRGAFINANHENENGTFRCSVR